MKVNITIWWIPNLLPCSEDSDQPCPEDGLVGLRVKREVRQDLSYEALDSGAVRVFREDLAEERKDVSTGPKEEKKG